MSYEKVIAEIEQEIQDFNQKIAIASLQNPPAMKDPAKFAAEIDYAGKRKEAAKNIYRILLTAFENMEKNNQELEIEITRLKNKVSVAEELIEHWKKKYQNKIFAND